MSDLPIPFPPSSEALPTALPLVLDIQHDTDPADDHGRARRIPHMGHAAIFFIIAGFCVILGVLIILTAAHIRTQADALVHPGYAIGAQAAAYLATLAISMAVFPLMWHRSFFSGVHWNGLVAIRHWKKILLLGLLVSFVSQAAMHFVSAPQDAPIDSLILNKHLIWYMAAFAIVLGPFMEELAFRGFLLPAIATAYDWLSLDRTPAGLQRWEQTTAHSTPALIVAAMLSSLPFALMHAAQIGYAWGVVGILYAVSLALSFVRIRTQSLACSTLMHGCYNFIIFALLFVSSDGFRHLEKIAH
ncbi:CPBP family intramembrane glutamic endopeptidase [Granulicella paludicola]|uniref:CPBP family intramembrane glutamic endopeptidase n=1 Tax=Granulicella paludicola TaxID=474951 RepID=UPI0021E02F5F|nr:type II CAAX endopeptidase family protein [Granulicella paludicola]